MNPINQAKLWSNSIFLRISGKIVSKVNVILKFLFYFILELNFRFIIDISPIWDSSRDFMSGLISCMECFYGGLPLKKR